MKFLVVLTVVIGLSFGQDQTPDQRREAFVEELWELSQENNCFTRQTGQDLAGIVDDNDDNIMQQQEFVELTSVALGNKPATCVYGKMAERAQENPVTIPNGVNKVFDSFQPTGDCISKETFKTGLKTIFKECRWPEDEDKSN